MTGCSLRGAAHHAKFRPPKRPSNGRPGPLCPILSRTALLRVGCMMTNRSRSGRTVRGPERPAEPLSEVGAVTRREMPGHVLAGNPDHREDTPIPEPQTERFHVFDRADDAGL